MAEGQRLVAELKQSQMHIDEIFVTPSFLEGSTEARRFASDLNTETTVIVVPEPLMAEMSDTVTPQGILAVFPIPKLEARAEDRLLVIPDGLRDPGNLGTLLRTAWAAGVTQVLLPPGTVDHTNPKVVRAGMGAHFHLPIQRLEWQRIWQIVSSAQVWVAEANRGPAHTQVDWTGDLALVIGGEAAGAGSRARHEGDFVHIPMARGVESLNAAVAAAILLFEIARQRGSV